MTLWSLLVAAGALSVERICYAWVWRKPEAFRSLCSKPGVARFGDPVDVLRNLFLCFKALQLAVFFGWCYLYGGGSFVYPHEDSAWGATGVVLIAIGQLLNICAFVRLGKIGIFYGNKFGYQVPWCRDFPFSVLRHPQYVGAVLSIWGFFMTTRFPYDDWFLLPVLQTGYYVAGAYLEQ